MHLYSEEMRKEYEMEGIPDIFISMILLHLRAGFCEITNHQNIFNDSADPVPDLPEGCKIIMSLNTNNIQSSPVEMYGEWVFGDYFGTNFVAFFATQHMTTLWIKRM